MIRLTIPSIEEDDLQAVREVADVGLPGAGSVGRRLRAGRGRITWAQLRRGGEQLHGSVASGAAGPERASGDLVLVTAYSWTATANVIELCGAQPVFVDIRPDTFNLDPRTWSGTLQRLMADVDTAGRVKAILPVHTFGQMAEMPAILEMADRYGLPGGRGCGLRAGRNLERRQAGAWGVMGCFSFHPRKAITTGEGGMITTDDADLARRLRALRNHGQDPDAAEWISSCRDSTIA